MKVIAAVCVLMAVALAAPEGQYYDSKYDNFDVDSILGNTRLMKAYAQCFLSKGKCTADGQNFKKWLPETLETGCAKCSPKQRILIRKVLNAVQELLPEEFEEMKKVYDPEGKYVETVKKFLEETD